MDAGRYLSTNPGHWIFLDSFAKELLCLDIESSSWVNLTLSGAQGKLNMRGDTILTLPDFTKTQRLYTFQNFAPIAKTHYPKESTISLRQRSVHYELQKTVPPEEDPNEPELWKTPFKRGFLLQIGQTGTKPIDTDALIRLSPQSRIKLSTNPPETGHRVNDVSMMYQLDTEKTSYEMGFSTANETSLKLVRSLRRFISIGGEWYTKHYPAPKVEGHDAEKRPSGRTFQRATLALRWSNISPSSREFQQDSPIPCPLEITGHVTLGQHYGIAVATSFQDDRLSLAASWKRQWKSKGIQKIALGMRIKFQLTEIPAFLKVTYSSYAGTAALFGLRFSGTLGVGIGVSYDHRNSSPQAALFFNL